MCEGEMLFNNVEDTFDTRIILHYAKRHLAQLDHLCTS